MKYEVKKEFILEAHAAACGLWKTKIEAQFPDLFICYNAGEKFWRWLDSKRNEYVLAMVSDNKDMNLINLSTGERFGINYRTAVAGVMNISEFKEFTKGYDVFRC